MRCSQAVNHWIYQISSQYPAGGSVFITSSHLRKERVERSPNMYRPSSYLLALLLSFLASIVWFSYSIKTFPPALPAFQGRTICSTETGVASSSVLQALEISEDIEYGSPKQTLPPKSISGPYYLPIIPSHQFFFTQFPSKLWQKVGPKGIDINGQSYIES